jgi:16S rRNA (cytosine1402-N4)-methyltransferase
VTLHEPVLLEEVLEHLAIKPDGQYFDGTFGRGGHSQAILDRLGPAGRLYAMDRDPVAVRVGADLAGRDRRFVIEQESFGQLRSYLEKFDVFGKLNGILLDLGVSSPQLDDAQRGFSFLADGPLDMRMDPGVSPSAAEWLNTAPEKEIVRVLFRDGEEKNARRIARAICQRRQDKPIKMTRELAALIEEIVPRRQSGKHPATRTFQGIRIHINDELQVLDDTLPVALDALAPGGRLCVISFHSLEDRRVKRFMRNNARVDPSLAQLPVVPESAQPRLRLPVRAIRAGTDEMTRNPRSRSATLRVAERL